MNKKFVIGCAVLCSVFIVGNLVLASSNVKAYGDINFGESKSTVKQKVRQDPDIDLDWAWENTIYSYITIRVKSHKAQFELDFYFFKDKLYRIRLMSPSRNANYFDTDVKTFRNKLVDIISSKYGVASWNQKLSFFDIKSGYVTFSHIWEAGDVGQTKEIKIGLGCSESAEYYAIMWVQYLPLVKAKEQAEKEKEKEDVEEQSENF